MNKKSIASDSKKEEQTNQKTGTKKNRLVKNSPKNESLHNIFDKLPEAIILTDTQGHIEYLNKEAISLFGEKAENSQLKEWPQVFGLYLDDGVTPYPDQKLPLRLALLGETKQEEEMILRKNNETEGIWISMSSQPLLDEDDQVNGAITFIRDITYRKQIENSRQKHIRHTEALYQLSHRIAEAGTNLKNLTQVIVKFTSEVIGDLSLLVLNNGNASEFEVAAFYDTNSAGHALMRKIIVDSAKIDIDRSVVGGVIKSGEPLLIPSIDPEQLKAITMPEFKDYIDQVGLESILIAPLSGRSGVLGALSLSRHRGSKTFTREDQTFLMDIAYRTALAIENCRLFESLRIEIAERLSTKQQLDSSEERFRAIFESTSLGIKVLDLNGNIIQTNSAFQKMIGYSGVELFGQHFSDFLFEEDVPQALNFIQALKVSGVTQYLFEHRAVCKDDSILWVRTAFSPVKKINDSEKLAYIVGIVENINERKQTEEEMNELRERLQSNVEMERLKLAQELHDNPMQILHSIMYRIEEIRSSAEPQLAESLESISSEVKMVLNALRATAKELRPPTIFDFGLENAIRSYTEDFLEKNPDLSITLSLAQDRQLLPEEMRLALFRIFQQALMNVKRHAEATEVKVRFSFDAEEVYLEISDNGKGFDVPPNWIGFVREGHYGLAGAAERASSLGGSLNVVSHPGNTTTINVTIPWSGT